MDTLNPSLLLVTLLQVVLHSTKTDGFRVGFLEWPAAEVVAVPGTQVRFSCATNVTAEKISWKFNSHFLQEPTRPPNASHPPPSSTSHNEGPSDGGEGFQVVPLESGGSELVIQLAEREEEYAHQLGLYQCVAWFGPIALTSLPGRLQAAVMKEKQEEEEEQGHNVKVEVEEVEVLEGGAVRVECDAPYSIPDPILTFYRDGEPLDLSSNAAYQITPHGDLLVAGVGAWAGGLYTCRAHNPVLGRIVAPPMATRVLVSPRGPNTPLSPTSFVTLRSVYTGQTGTNLTLQCLANGNPQPAVRWERYANVLPPHASQGSDGSLFLPSLAIGDAGTYLCHAGIGVGMEKQMYATVEVVEPPSLVVSPESQQVEEGSSLILHCTARGHPTPKVMWVFNGELVFEYGNVAITDTGLMIRAVQKDHAGIFQCFAHNPEGAVQGVAMVSVVPRTVTALPGATHRRPEDNAGPRNKAEEDGNGSSVLELSKGGGGRGRSRVRGSRRGRKGQKRKKVEGEGHFSLSGGNGKKRKGSKGNRKKGRMVPPSVPSITKVSHESVMVTWDAPPETRTLPISFYKIQYKLVRNRGQEGSHWMTADDIILPHITSHEVTGLETGRVYRFRIAAVYANNDNLLGPTSRRFLLERDSNTQRPAHPPTITTLTPVSATAVRLAWHYTPSPGSPIEGFFIHYREATVAGDYTKVTVLDSDTREYIVSHLKANVSYDFKIQCFNMAGPSDFSQVAKKTVPGQTSSTTQGIEEEEEMAGQREVVPVVREGEPGVVSSTHLYIILGAALGLLLLIVVTSASVYTCRSKHSDDDTRSVKYEDTALHIHRETSTYSLPQTPRSKASNGYLPHQSLTITTANDEKAVMESALNENNNHSTSPIVSDRCFTSPARRIASREGCMDIGMKALALVKTAHDTSRPATCTDTNAATCPRRPS